jgi:transposase
MGQITVFSGPERRRCWGNEQRLQILTEAFAPGACLTEVARRLEISTGQLYTWRSKLAVDAPPTPDDGDGPGFPEAVVIKGGDTALSGTGAAIVIDLPRDRRLTIFP